jgi:hypothetical protein
MRRFERLRLDGSRRIVAESEHRKVLTSRYTGGLPAAYIPVLSNRKRNGNFAKLRYANVPWVTRSVTRRYKVFA